MDAKPAPPLSPFADARHTIGVAMGWRGRPVTGRPLAVNRLDAERVGFKLPCNSDSSERRADAGLSNILSLIASNLPVRALRAAGYEVSQLPTALAFFRLESSYDALGRQFGRRRV